MAKRKRSKYGVSITKEGIEKRTYNGETYDSLTELRFLQEFILPKMESGKIINWTRQDTFILQEGFTKKDGSKVLPIKYVSDFIVYWKDGSRTVFDVKGQPDSLSKCKRKIFWKRYPDEEYIWMCRNIKFGDESHWLTYEELEAKRKAEKKAKKDGK
jgi:hypothetical protein